MKTLIVTQIHLHGVTFTHDEDEGELTSRGKPYIRENTEIDRLNCEGGERNTNAMTTKMMMIMMKKCRQL